MYAPFRGYVTHARFRNLGKVRKPLNSGFELKWNWGLTLLVGFGSFAARWRKFDTC